MKDAAAYLNEVKTVFQEEDQNEKFDEFVNVLNDFHAKRIDRSSVIGKARELLKWHKDLIFGFNKFLGKGSSEIALPASELEEEAHSFYVKVKNRFEGTDRFEKYVDILDKYSQQTKTLTEVRRELAVLFRDQNDLLQGLARYLK